MTTKTSKSARPKAPAQAPKGKGEGKTEATSREAAEPGRAAAMAAMALRPSVNAAAVIEAYTKPLGAQDLEGLIDSLRSGIEDLWAGDMKRAEAMLYGQAHALQAIFMNLALRAANQEYLKNSETFLRMALKAQNQSRMTLETLATIKNPPVVFARQANINNGGQQQVNNGAAGVSGPVRPRAGAPAVNQTNVQTELLEASHGQRLDTGTTGATGGADPHMESVGTFHRPTHR